MTSKINTTFTVTLRLATYFVQRQNQPVHHNISDQAWCRVTSNVTHGMDPVPRTVATAFWALRKASGDLERVVQVPHGVGHDADDHKVLRHDGGGIRLVRDCERRAFCVRFVVGVDDGGVLARAGRGRAILADVTTDRYLVRMCTAGATECAYPSDEA